MGEVLAEVLDEDGHGAGEYPAIAEPGAGQKQADGGAHEGDDVLLLVRVHAGRDEEPDLVEDERAGDDGADDDRGLDEKVERVGGMRHGHLETDIEQRPLDVFDEADVEDVGDDEADGDPGDGVDEPRAELVRCSMRLMPGSSARSVTALRARSMRSRSAMLRDLAGGDR